MDCRTFRKKHIAFVDDTLPGIDQAAMQRHLGDCPDCAHHDTTIRRALLLFRNLPQIEPSSDFAARLEARLQRERAMPLPTTSPYAHGPGVRAFMATAAGVLLVGYLALSLLGRGAEMRAIALAPVVATEPEHAFPLEVSPPLATPALVASVSAGVPVWPVMLLAEQAPVHFASEQFAR